MNLLLDSHTLLWLMLASPSLSTIAASLIANPANRLNLSMASAWEIAIKSGLGKMGLTVPYATFLTTALTGYGLTMLPITEEDCVHFESLPFPDKNHRDPFDRMIIVHAMRHGMSIVGVDMAFDSYHVTRLW